MRFITACFAVCALFALTASAAAPSTPTWPSAWSGSVLVNNVTNPEYSYFLRTFVDYKSGSQRWDGFAYFNGLMVFREQIIVGTAGYDIWHVGYDEISCYTFTLNGTIPAPDFSQFKYAGQSLIDYEAVNHWVAPDPQDNAFFEYFEGASDREPVRFNLFTRGWEESWTFFEFDAGSQDATLFQVPALIESICQPY
eukprot:TRINITY_DN984_c0_g1_i1.p1 TRINITY_DN984_c0_g1~~TRINITY_DN984_c0_g1_i1.p1  ORF type:complete len:196 (-),score=77.92 TRINITY_DN984_c0_g1_i1:80-667(-)